MDISTLVALITKGETTYYRKDLDLLTKWCKDNNLLLNVSKTEEIDVNFQKDHTQHSSLITDGAAVERVSSTTFLGLHISEDLSWTTNMASLVKKAQKRLYFLRKLKKASASPPIMTTLYGETTESILSSCITASQATTGEPSSTWQTQPEKLLGHHSLHCKIYTHHPVHSKSTDNCQQWKPSCTQSVQLPALRERGGAGISAPEPPDSETASPSRPSGCWTLFPLSTAYPPLIPISYLLSPMSSHRRVREHSFSINSTELTINLEPNLFDDLSSSHHLNSFFLVHNTHLMHLHT